MTQSYKIQLILTEMSNRIPELQNYVENSHIYHRDVEKSKEKFNIIQTYFEILFEFLNGVRSIVHDEGNLRTKCHSLLNKLINHSLVFQHQPEPVLKIRTEFESGVRLLIGKCIDNRDLDVEVRVQIISAETAQEILNMGLIPDQLNVGVVNHNVRDLTWNEQTNVYEAYFGNLNIRARPGGNQPNQPVTSKNCLLATSNINYGGTSYQLHKLSSPFVAISHNRQQAIAWATVLFSDPNDALIRVEEMSWLILADALNAKFVKDTGRGLTSENLEFLCWKLTSEHLPVANRNPTVTWAQFATNKVQPVHSKSDFTFWEWVYANLQLIIHQPAHLWREGYIEGFVSRSQVDSKLRICKDGTFVFRFSDSVLGGITIGYVENCIVYHIAPYTISDLTVDLIQRLTEFYELKFIYPDIPKNYVH